jgi:hypothetical protein
LVPATKLQSLYNKLYIQLRKYIWDFKTVEDLADFEISVYRRFPDKEDIEKVFYRLKRDITTSDIYREDDDLKYAVEAFENQLDETDQFYADLDTFREVVDTNENDDSEEQVESEDSEFTEDDFRVEEIEEEPDTE